MIEALFVMVVVAIVLVLPFVAWAKASRALREIAQLRLEVRRGFAQAPPPARAPEPAPPPHIEPVAPPHAGPAPTPRPPEPPRPVAPTPIPIPTEVPIESRPAPTPAAAPAAVLGVSLEARIGGRWLLYLGVGAIVIAVAYFVKLAFDNRWITETMRVVIGGVAGLALAWIGRRFARAGYRLYGQMLTGGGIAILYLSVYAAFNFYAIVGRVPAFGLMVVVTALAAWLADRDRAQGLAVMAVGGGFFTPFMVGGETDAQVALFGYDAILVAGTAYLSHRRDWPALNLLSYWFTVVTIVGWAARYYADPAYLRTVLFLTLFCALFGYILWQSWRSTHVLAPVVRLVLASAPPLYYVASVALLFTHALAFLIFVVAVTLAGLVVARRAQWDWARLWLWVAVAWPLAAWAATRGTAPWVPGGLTVAMAIYALHLVSLVDRIGQRPADAEATRPVDLLLLHVNGLGLFGIVYLLLEDRGPTWLGGAAALLALANAALALWAPRLRRELAWHFGAVAAALATAAVAFWTDGAWLVLGLAVEAAGLVAIGLWSNRDGLRLCGGLLLGLALLWFLQLEFEPVTTGTPVVFNARTAVAIVLAALFYGLTVLHRRDTGPLAARARQDSDYFLLALNVVLFTAITTEINAFWERRGGGRPVALSRMASLAVAWTLQAIGVIRVGLTREREWLRKVGIALLFLPIAWVSVSLWGDVLLRTTPPAGYVVFVNARAVAALVLILGLYALASMHRRAAAARAGGWSFDIALVTLAASLVTLGWLSAESSAFWYLRDAAGGDPRRAFFFARELTLSLLWAGYAAALVAAGIQRRYAPIRYFAIALFLVTVVKVGFVDLAQLERLYRVLSVMALGLLLLLASFLYQRYRV